VALCGRSRALAQDVRARAQAHDAQTTRKYPAQIQLSNHSQLVFELARTLALTDG